MLVADVHAAPRRTSVQKNRRTSSVTARREGAAPRPVTAADLERITDKLAGKIDASEERINDKLADAKAQADARQLTTREARAQDQARIDAMAEELARQGRRGEEILASSTRGYRNLEQAQSEIKEAFEARLKSLEERAAPEAADIAMHVGAAVVESNRTDNRRIAGIAMVGGTFGLGAAVMGCINFVSNHTALVVKGLHLIGLGLGKIPTPPHE